MQQTSFCTSGYVSLKRLITVYGDTQARLAEALSLSRSTLNSKLNKRNGACLTYGEIMKIIGRYRLELTRCADLFFFPSPAE